MNNAMPPKFKFQDNVQHAEELTQNLCATYTVITPAQNHRKKYECVLGYSNSVHGMVHHSWHQTTRSRAKTMLPRC